MKIQNKLNFLFHRFLFQLFFPVIHFLNSLFRGKKSNKVLVISLNYIGDVLMGSPAIRGLKKLRPEIQIDIWIKKEAIPLVQYNSDINKYYIDSSAHSKTNNTLFSFWKTIQKNFKVLTILFNQNYDIVFDFTGSFESAFFSGIIGKKKRFGLSWRPHFRNAFNGVVDGYAKVQHLRNINCDIVKIAGFNIDRNECQYSLIIPKDIEKWADNLISQFDTKSVITLAPFAGWKQKEWSLGKFVDLSIKLSDYGATVLFIGSNSDAQRLKPYENHFNSQIINFCGKTSLLESAALIKHSTLFIGLDSSQSHIADALHTQSIIIFGPTNPFFHQMENNPFVKIIYKNISCSAHRNKKYCHENCFSFECPNDHLCTNLIDADEVFNETKKILDIKNVLQSNV